MNRWLLLALLPTPALGATELHFTSDTVEFVATLDAFDAIGGDFTPTSCSRTDCVASIYRNTAPLTTYGDAFDAIGLSYDQRPFSWFYFPDGALEQEGSHTTTLIPWHVATLTVSGHADVLPLPPEPRLPVPEPASWLLAVLGFGLVGAVTRASAASARRRSVG